MHPITNHTPAHFPRQDRKYAPTSRPSASPPLSLSSRPSYPPHRYTIQTDPHQSQHNPIQSISIPTESTPNKSPRSAPQKSVNRGCRRYSIRPNAPIPLQPPHTLHASHSQDRTKYIASMTGPRRRHVVIQQPPTYSLHHPNELQPDPIIPYPHTLFRSPAFHSQRTLIEKHLDAKSMSWVRESPLPAHVFTTQVAEIDDLLDAGRKLDNLCTLAADDCPPPGPPPSKAKLLTANWSRPQRPVRRWDGDLEPLYYNGLGLPISP